MPLYPPQESVPHPKVSCNPVFFHPIDSHTIDFLPKCTLESGRMPFTVTREGKEIQMRRYYFSETFAAIGCAEYYLATGDKVCLEERRKLTTLIGISGMARPIRRDSDRKPSPKRERAEPSDIL